MKQYIALTGMILLVLLIAPSLYAAEAAAEGKMIAVEGRIGIAMPTGDFGDIAGSAFTGGGGFMYEVYRHLVLEANLNYASFGGEEFMGFEASDKGVTEFTGGMRYFFTSNMVQPYGAFGLGLYHWTLDKDLWDARNDFGFNFGGGALINFTEKMGLDAAVRYHIFDSGIDEFDKNINYAAITVGLVYKF
jgi:opacity protein-like surface antigen